MAKDVEAWFQVGEHEGVYILLGENRDGERPDGLGGRCLARADAALLVSSTQAATTPTTPVSDQ